VRDGVRKEGRKRKGRENARGKGWGGEIALGCIVLLKPDVGVSSKRPLISPFQEWRGWRGSYGKKFTGKKKKRKRKKS
jgi:hypothetical protein